MTKLISTKRDISVSAIVPIWFITSDSSWRVHWFRQGAVAKSQGCVKSSSPVPGSISGCQHRDELAALGKRSSGCRSLSNDTYASELANDGVRYHVGRGISEGLRVGCVEVRLGDDNACVRNVDKELRTMSFD